MTITNPLLSIRAVLFDLDGTLLDTAPDFVTALNRLLVNHGRPRLDPAIIRAGVTHGSAGLISLAFGLTPKDADFDALKQEFLDYYLECLTEKTRLFPGMDGVLTRLNEQDIAWGIVTNKPALYTRAILDGLELPSAPAAIICPDHVKQTKPHPEPVLMACTALKIEPRNGLVVGDHLRDIQSGLQAGCYTVSAAYGYIDAGENPANWGAHYLINHAQELNRIIFHN